MALRRIDWIAMSFVGVFLCAVGVMAGGAGLSALSTVVGVVLLTVSIAALLNATPESVERRAPLPEGRAGRRASDLVALHGATMSMRLGQTEPPTGRRGTDTGRLRAAAASDDAAVSTAAVPTSPRPDDPAVAEPDGDFAPHLALDGAVADGAGASEQGDGSTLAEAELPGDDELLLSADLSAVDGDGPTVPRSTGTQGGADAEAAGPVPSLPIRRRPQGSLADHLVGAPPIGAAGSVRNAPWPGHAPPRRAEMATPIAGLVVVPIADDPDLEIVELTPVPVARRADSGNRPDVPSRSDALRPITPSRGVAALTRRAAEKVRSGGGGRVAQPTALADLRREPTTDAAAAPAAVGVAQGLASGAWHRVSAPSTGDALAFSGDYAEVDLEHDLVSQSPARPEPVLWRTPLARPVAASDDARGEEKTWSGLPTPPDELDADGWSVPDDIVTARRDAGDADESPASVITDEGGLETERPSPTIWPDAGAFELRRVEAPVGPAAAAGGATLAIVGGATQPMPAMDAGARLAGADGASLASDEGAPGTVASPAEHAESGAAVDVAAPEAGAQPAGADGSSTADGPPTLHEGDAAPVDVDATAAAGNIDGATAPDVDAAVAAAATSEIEAAPAPPAAEEAPSAEPVAAAPAPLDVRAATAEVEAAAHLEGDPAATATSAVTVEHPVAAVDTVEDAEAVAAAAIASADESTSVDTESSAAAEPPAADVAGAVDAVDAVTDESSAAVAADDEDARVTAVDEPVVLLPKHAAPSAPTREHDWVWDLRRGSVSFAERWWRLMESPAHEAGPEEILGRLVERDRDRLLAELTATLHRPYDRRFWSTALVRDSGVALPVEFELRATRDLAGDVVRVAANVRTGTTPHIVPTVTAPTAVAGAAAATRLSQLAEALAAAGIGYCEVDAHGVVAHATPSLSRLVADWGTEQRWWSAIAPRIGTSPRAGIHTLDVVTPRGVRRILDLSVVDDDAGAVVVVRDATDAQLGAESLRNSEARYALAAMASNDGLWDWNLETDEVYYSPRWLAILGLAAERAVGLPSTWFGRVHADDLDGLREAIDGHLGGATPHLEHEHRILHADGTYRWVQARGMTQRRAGDVPYRFAGSLSDVTERKDAEAQLVHDALYDTLTRLPNRALFMDLLERAIRRQRRRPEAGFAVLFLDLDRFKLVNDSLGHLVGDRLLQEVAERLKESLRLGDTVARLGGDEFTVLLEEANDASEASAVAERIHRSFSRPFVLGEHEVYTSTSIGIAMSSRHYERPEEILRDADTAMYRAKSLGKAQHAIFDSEMHAAARSLLRLHTDLRSAIQNEELEVQYQPIVDLATGVVAGFEALVRWRHPDRGLIWPDEFIPIAEETGLIEDVSMWILRAAVTQIARWRRAHPEMPELSVSVNLSSRSFGSARLVTAVEQVLAEAGVVADALRVEVTEGTVMSHPSAADVLASLRAMGVRIYLDDFGTGYSSLAYLQRYPVDALKIDRSFIAKLTDPSDPTEIVGAIASLAHSMGLKVIAEGVQTAAQVERLRALGCDYGQGYLFSRPLDPAYAGALLAEKPSWV